MRVGERSGRPAYGLINHGMIGERRTSVKRKFELELGLIEDGEDIIRII